ncbi:MAG: hypothetical protein AUI85_09140 [Acidobacteriales bacterium 13_1_40CM_3_55_5]|nr:MAG: hypothetical protein AUI85_09140 [Acidobacteriales bacterium 13_1_40CM_3_55_5]
MADREHLRALVDSLPEGALESAQAYLKAIQIWPPKEPEYPPEVQQHRKELEAKRDKFLKGHASGTWAVDRKNKSHASFGTSEHNWETGEYTIRTFHVYYDFPMEITERIRLKDEDQTLQYDFHISGLGNEHSFGLRFKANGG